MQVILLYDLDVRLKTRVPVGALNKLGCIRFLCADLWGARLAAVERVMASLLVEFSAGAGRRKIFRAVSVIYRVGLQAGSSDHTPDPASAVLLQPKQRHLCELACEGVMIAPGKNACLQYCIMVFHGCDDCG